MNKYFRFLLLKNILIMMVISFSIIFILPIFFPHFWPYKKIVLGLDLVGGMQVTLEVETNEAIDSSIKQYSTELKYILKDESVEAEIGTKLGNIIYVILQDKNDIAELLKILAKNFSYLEVLRTEVSDLDFYEFNLKLTKKEEARVIKFAVDQTLEIMRNRIDQFGVSEPDIRIKGSNEILIQLPGIKDIQRAKNIIGQTAVLEFRVLGDNEGRGDFYDIDEYHQFDNEMDKFLLKNNFFIVGSHLNDARVSINLQDNKPYVMLKLNKVGARIFEKITSENINKRLAIILDGNIHSAPVITERISGGKAVITGSFSLESARDLALILRAGALPVPVKIIEERIVGPSLGLESIKTGFMSMCVGGLSVILFMVLYYKIAGIIADFALLLNLLIIAAALSMFHATLTLPGIAGLILTIGIAVDANVLIFERVKEEIRNGRSPMNSLIVGYDKVMLTVLDANITTLIAALVLFQFGAGPIKGFAITLVLGILASLFTSLIVTKTVFENLFKYFKIDKISI